jgi:hypothetical protein
MLLIVCASPVDEGSAIFVKYCGAAVSTDRTMISVCHVMSSKDKTEHIRWNYDAETENAGEIINASGTACMAQRVILGFVGRIYGVNARARMPVCSSSCPGGHEECKGQVAKAKYDWSRKRAIESSIMSRPGRSHHPSRSMTASRLLR